MPRYLDILLPVPLGQSFDYALPEGMPIPLAGARVRVPFGKREKIGFVQGSLSAPRIALDKVKPILECIDTTPLFDEQLFAFLKRASDYYHHPLGEVLAAALPKALREGKIIQEDTPFSHPVNEVTNLTFSSEQQISFDTIKAHIHQYQAFLLQGATGSGKTEANQCGLRQRVRSR